LSRVAVRVLQIVRQSLEDAKKMKQRTGGAARFGYRFHRFSKLAQYIVVFARNTVQQSILPLLKLKSPGEPVHSWDGRGCCVKKAEVEAPGAGDELRSGEDDDVRAWFTLLLADRELIDVHPTTFTTNVCHYCNLFTICYQCTISHSSSISLS